MKDGMRWGWEWGVANPLPPGRGVERPEKGWEGSVLCGIKIDFVAPEVANARAQRSQDSAVQHCSKGVGLLGAVK